MSGLNINLDKTNVLWTGTMFKSDKIPCREFNLEWEQKPYNILGVIFTPEVFDIWDYKSDVIMKKLMV